MSNLYVKWSDFEASRLIETTLQSKQSKPKVDPKNPDKPPEAISYHQLPIKYRYKVTTPDGKIIEMDGPLRIEGPKVRAPRGIRMNEQDGRPTASISVEYDLADKDVAKFLSVGDGEEGKDPGGAWEQMYTTFSERLFALKDQVSLKKIRNIQSLQGAFAHPIPWTFDKAGNAITTVNPTKFYNVSYFEKINGKKELIIKRAPFNYPILDKKETKPGKPKYLAPEWNVLTDGANMLVSLMYHVKHIYIGGDKASFQMEVTSGVIYSIEPGVAVSQAKQLAEAEANEEIKKKILGDIENVDKYYADAKIKAEEAKAEKEAKGGKALPGLKPKLPLPKKAPKDNDEEEAEAEDEDDEEEKKAVVLPAKGGKAAPTVVKEQLIGEDDSEEEESDKKPAVPAKPAPKSGKIDLAAVVGTDAVPSTPLPGIPAAEPKKATKLKIARKATAASGGGV